MTGNGNDGEAAPGESKPAAKEDKPSIPNNLDHMVLSGLMEGSFSGPFDIDFEGNHTLVVGPSGQVTLYRATRTAPVAFIAKGSSVHVSAGMADCQAEVHAEGEGCELTAVVKDLSGLVVTPVDSRWLSLEKGILEAAYDLQGRFGRRRIARILAGTNSLSTVTGTLHDLRLFGRFRRYSAQQVVEKVDELLAQGMLETSKKGQFALVRITPEGEKRMLALRKELGVVDLAFNGQGEDPAAAKLAGTLKSWRARRGKEENLPLYVVLRNDALSEIARARPSDKDALARCRGVGKTTLERWGEEILALVKESAQDTGKASAATA